MEKLEIIHNKKSKYSETKIIAILFFYLLKIPKIMNCLTIFEYFH